MDYPTYKLEASLIERGHTYVVGVDEVGRGTGAGAVVAASVYIPPDKVSYFEGKVRDSKKLSENKREGLYEDITSMCRFGIGEVDNKVIDELNILEATKLAMSLSLKELGRFDYALIDGNFSLPYLLQPQRCVIKGDVNVLSIAAASILAKVYRDREMKRLHKEYPIYNWEKNKGYLTKEHREALSVYGLCEYHRQSFKLN